MQSQSYFISVVIIENSVNLTVSRTMLDIKMKCAAFDTLIDTIHNYGHALLCQFSHLVIEN